MPIINVPGVGRVNFPEGMSHDEIVNAIETEVIPQHKAAIAPAATMGEAFKGGLKQMLSSGETALAAPFTGGTEAGLAGIARQQAMTERPGASLEQIKSVYGEKGLLPAIGEVGRQIPKAIAEQAPNLAATLGAARLGAMAGAPLGPWGVTGGALLGAALPSFVTQAGGNIERQVQEAQAAGKPVDVNLAQAYGAAVPQAALDVAADRIAFGKLLGLTPKVMGTPAAEKLAKEKLLRTLGVGTVKGAVAEVPTEVAQQMLERLQAGLPLTTDDAVSEYASTAYQTALLGPVGGVSRISERSAARDQVAQAQAQRDATIAEVQRNRTMREQNLADIIDQQAQTQADIEGQQAVQDELARQQQETQQKLTGVLGKVMERKQDKAELNTLLQTSDGVSQVIKNTKAYFPEYGANEINQIRNDLKTLRKTLPSQEEVARQQKEAEYAQTFAQLPEEKAPEVDPYQVTDEMITDLGIGPRNKKAREALANLGSLADPAKMEAAKEILAEYAGERNRTTEQINAIQQGVEKLNRLDEARQRTLPLEATQYQLPEAAAPAAQEVVSEPAKKAAEQKQYKLFDAQGRPTSRGIAEDKLRADAEQQRAEQGMGEPVLPEEAAPEETPADVTGGVGRGERPAGAGAEQPSRGARAEPSALATEAQKVLAAEPVEDAWEAMSDIPFKEMSKDAQRVIKEAHADGYLSQAEADRITQVEAANKTKEQQSKLLYTPEEEGDLGLQGSKEPTRKPKFKMPKRTEPSEIASSVEDVQGTFGQLFNKQQIAAKKPNIVQSYDQLPEGLREQAEDKNASAFVDPKTGEEYYVADQIPQGDEKGKTLHEKGVHLGLPKLIGKDRIKALANRVDRWGTEANKLDPKQQKLEHKIATEAIDMALESGEEIGTDRFNQEVIAYFTEIAVNRYNIDPLKTQPKENAKVAGWLRELWAGILNTLKKLHYKPESLKAKDIVDLVYGAARIESREATAGAGAIQASKAEKITPNVLSQFAGGKREVRIEPVFKDIVQIAPGTRIDTTRGRGTVISSTLGDSFDSEKHRQAHDELHDQAFAGYKAGQLTYEQAAAIKQQLLDKYMPAVRQVYRAAHYTPKVQMEDGTIRSILPSNIKEVYAGPHSFKQASEIQASRATYAQPTQAELAAEQAAGRQVFTKKAEPTLADKIRATVGNDVLGWVGNKLVGGNTAFEMKATNFFGPEARLLNGKELGYLNYHRALHDTDLATGAAQYGFLELDKEGVFHVRDSADNIVALNKLAEAAKAAMKASGMSEAMAYSGFNHMVMADRAHELQRQGVISQKEFSPQDYAFGKKLQQQYGKEYKAWHDMYQRIRARTMKALVDGGVYNQRDAKRLLDRLEYVPFHRDQDPGVPDGVFLRSLLSAKAEQHIRGSEKSVSDVMDNIVDNQVWLLKRAVRNNAANLIADTMEEMHRQNPGMGGYAIPQDDKQGNNVSFLKNGKLQWFKVLDKNDAAIFSAAPIISNLGLQIARTWTAALRKGVTLMPSFFYGQIIQDAMRAPIVAGTEKGMFKLMRTSVPEMFKNINGETPLARELRRAGIVGQIDYQDTYDNWKHEMFGNVRTGVSKYLELGERAAQANDMATRNAVYEDVLNKTGDKNEASLRALMMINFQNRGHSRLMNGLMATVPFVNSRIQGEYRLLMALSGRIPGVTKEQAKQMVLWRVAKFAAFTALYTMAVSGDDDYEKANEELKNGNFLLGGVKVPVAPEFKPIKVAIEKSYRLMTDQQFETEGKAFRALGGAVAGLAFSAGDMTPTMIRPLLENMTNYSFFAGRPLVGYHQQSVDVNLRFNESTSAVAKGISNFLQELGGDAVNVSPIKIDNLIRGWFGSLGRDVLFTTNMIAGDMPDPKVNQMPIAAGFFYDTEGGALKSDYYQLRDQSDRATATYNDLKKSDPVKAAEYFKENQALIVVNKQLNGIGAIIDKQRAMRAIWTAQAPDKARPLIDQQNAELHELLKQALPPIMQFLDEHGA